MIKKITLKIIPFLIAFIIGIILFYIALNCTDDIKSLLINISSAFLAIPLIYLFYEIIKTISQNKLNKEIFDYAKMQIDRELMSILNQIQKLIYSLEKKDFSFKGINEFLSLSKDDITNLTKNNTFIGFQIFKHWEISENNLHDILKNPYILNKMDDELIISIIIIIKNIRNIQDVLKIENLYIEVSRMSDGFKIVKGSDLNPQNTDYPDRHLLLKYLHDGKFVVSDFGDIPKYNLDKCLHQYKLNPEYASVYNNTISDMINEINHWLDLTGKEFIVDTKIFRIHKYKKY